MDSTKIIIIIVIAIVVIIIIYVAYQFLSGNAAVDTGERVAGDINKWFGERNQETKNWFGNKGAFFQGKEIWKW